MKNVNNGIHNLPQHEAPVFIWDKIEKELDEDNKKRGFFVLNNKVWKYAAGLVLFLGIGAGIFISLPMKKGITVNAERRGKNEERRVKNGESRMDNEEGRMENEERRVKNGERRMENGQRRMENEERRENNEKLGNKIENYAVVSKQTSNLNIHNIDSLKIKLVSNNPGNAPAQSVTNNYKIGYSGNQRNTQQHYDWHAPTADVYKNIETVNVTAVKKSTIQLNSVQNSGTMGSTNWDFGDEYIVGNTGNVSGKIPQGSDLKMPINKSNFRVQGRKKGKFKTEELTKKTREDKKNIDSDRDGVPDLFEIKTDTIREFNASNSESYSPLIENNFVPAKNIPQSTFSIDVDNASYTNTRRLLLGTNQLPPIDAVRIEECVNFFKYNYPVPTDKKVPFTVTTELAESPWNAGTQILAIGLKGYELQKKEAPESNLVFLIDVSGSMQTENKLPLVKKSLMKLINQLGENDKIALVTYAGMPGLVLPSTSCNNKQTILNAINNLEAGGSTAGGAGIELAYKVAKENFLANGNNRIILVTDGDFNVDLSSDEAMKTLVQEKKKEGIYITCCGVGMGNYKDSKMEIIADNGDGNYFYIDNEMEAQRLFVDGISGTLFTIAKDVKIQVEFNPTFVKAYRLIGYENRKLQNQDFVNDAVDAGELGAGHTVTALYEVVLRGSNYSIDSFTEVDSAINTTQFQTNSKDLATVRLRYKLPANYNSESIETNVLNNPKSFKGSSDNFKFACGVTCFAQLLRHSKYVGNSSYDMAKNLIEQSAFMQGTLYKNELLLMIEKAKLLSALP